MEMSEYMRLLMSISHNVADRGAAGQYVPRRDGIVLHDIKLRQPSVSLGVVYRANDFYILGFLAHSVLFRFRDTNYNFPGYGAPQALSFGSSYKELGLDRNDAYRLTLDELGRSVETLAATTPETMKAVRKADAAALVVGFAEAVRFSDVAMKVAQGRRIDLKNDLDWKVRSKDDADFRVHIRKP